MVVPASFSDAGGPATGGRESHGSLGRHGVIASTAAIGAVLAVVALASCSSATTGGGQGGDGAAALPATTTTVMATTTDAPTTTAAPTTSTSTLPSTTTIPPTTTTTTPPNIVAVSQIEPLAAVNGNSGEATSKVQWRLLELGFWLQEPDGNYGLTTRQAVMAFQKYMGFEADGYVDQRTADALTNMTVRPIARANAGTLVEVDKAKQLLFFVIDGKTTWILNTSTGNGEEYEEEDKNSPGETIKGVSLTPSGLHHVNRERPEGWWEGDLGEIYRPKYFVGGVAVHGSNSVPNYPASHGCVRVTVQAMDWIWDNNLMPMGIPVWVHDGA